MNATSTVYDSMQQNEAHMHNMHHDQSSTNAASIPNPVYMSTGSVLNCQENVAYEDTRTVLKVRDLTIRLA